MEVINRAAAVVAEVRAELAPDPRLAVFEIEIEWDGDRLVLLGATSEPTAGEVLHRRVALLEEVGEVLDAVHRLPLPGGTPMHALVSSATAPMLAAPLVSGPSVSHTLLGHRLLVLREHGRWLHCRSEDGYLGWVHRGYVRRMDESEVRSWELGAGGEACFSLGAEVRRGDGEVVGRLPWGCRFLRRGEEALLPNGLAGTLSGDWVALPEKQRRFPPLREEVVATAGRWLGAPYLWGGTIPAGVDCSGLAQASYRTYGVLLPRDSDQQARIGEAVDPGHDFSRLRRGISSSSPKSRDGFPTSRSPKADRGSSTPLSGTAGYGRTTCGGAWATNGSCAASSWAPAGSFRRSRPRRREGKGYSPGTRTRCPICRRRGSRPGLRRCSSRTEVS